MRSDADDICTALTMVGRRAGTDPSAIVAPSSMLPVARGTQRSSLPQSPLLARLGVFLASQTRLPCCAKLVSIAEAPRKEPAINAGPAHLLRSSRALTSRTRTSNRPGVPQQVKPRTWTPSTTSKPRGWSRNTAHVVSSTTEHKQSLSCNVPCIQAHMRAYISRCAYKHTCVHTSMHACIHVF